jgi:hypothetical protein
MRSGSSYLKFISESKVPYVLEILKIARKKIARRGGWTQGVDGRDKEGNPVDVFYSNKACSFCAIGAITRACDEVFEKTGELIPNWVVAGFLRASIFGEVRDELNNDHRPSIVQWNDVEARHKKEILAGFDKGIKAAKEEVELLK